MGYLVKKRKGFTIVEILISLLIASVVLITLLNFFGDTFQKFVQHEDTLTSAREIHKLLEYLRKDIEILVPGKVRELGIVFPQQVAHLYHSSESDVLRTYHWTKETMGEPFQDTDPIVNNLPPSKVTDRLLNRYNALSGSCSWSIDESEGQDRKKFILSFLIQPDPDDPPLPKLITYVYDELNSTVTRYDEGTMIVFAKEAVSHFSVIPVFDFYNFPGEPEKTIVLNKMFFDILITIKADEDGGKIVKRPVTITTKACPRLINNAVVARWSN
jgi:prepilin-type N-terminal cleavage/methylation domain-containing protein